METNRWIAISRRIYARLLNLYPQPYRSEYGPAMLQLFVDQCRAACRRGGVGLSALWLRTLFDLGLSALSEHLSAPGAKWGLLEAVPNRPLPWKGVALVLIPGLVLFASQVAQTAGENWFFATLLWAPYILMAIVLLVWLASRKYPVWGLMPLGLLSSNLVYYGSRLITTWHLSFYDGPASLRQFVAVFSNGLNSVQSSYSWMVAREGLWAVLLGGAFVFLPAVLIAVYQRRQPLSPAIWILLGIYLALSVLQVVLKIQNYLDSMQISVGNANLYYALLSGDLTAAGTYVPAGKTIIAFWTLYGSGAFLFLIFAGVLLARRYGDLVVLFPLGYVLGEVVYGYYNGYEDNMLYLVIGGVLVYRILMALVAPVWISRSAGRRRDLALVISIGLAFAAQIVLHESMLSYFSSIYEDSHSLVTAVMRWSPVLDPLVVAVGLALAITLYRQAGRTAPLEKAPGPGLVETAPR